MNIIVSSCLLGVKCRYDGQSKMNEMIMSLSEKYNLIPVCPEVYGGLPTPRPPCECVDDKVINCEGKDCTRQYVCGAEETLRLAKLFDCKIAVLKERSPSCGIGNIYSGKFDGTLVDGNGVTANLLIKNGIRVINENSINEIL